MLRLLGLTGHTAGCLVLGAALAGCGSPATGVIAEVSWADPAAALELTQLEVHVGVQRGGGPFVADDESPLMIEVTGRDLTADAYQLLVEGSGGDDARVMVIALGRVAGQPVASGRFASSRSFVAGKLLVEAALLTPDDGVIGGDGCLRWVEDGQRAALGTAVGDRDCDGDLDADDCDPDDPAFGPTAPDPCDELDQDCDGRRDDDDLDTDGVRACEDCDDGDDRRAPGLAEVCDGLDNDCDGGCDVDADGDGWSTCGTVSVDGTTCAVVVPPAQGDCDDGDPRRVPGLAEVCDGVDNDCDDRCDPGFDADNDGVSVCGSVVRGRKCILMLAPDCDDGDRTRYPGAIETCDGVDRDCDPSPLVIPCFTPGGASCEAGTATCAEVGGVPTLSACATGGFGAPASACDAWAGCAAGPLVDVIDCIDDSGAISSQELACTVPLDADGAPCLPAEATLPVLAPSPCTQRVLGGASQATYGVTLVDGAASGIEVAACTASLRLVSALRSPIVAETILLQTTAAGTNAILPVVLVPAVSPTTCGGGTTTLACTLRGRN